MVNFGPLVDTCWYVLCVAGLMLYSGQSTDGSGDFISFGMRDRRAEFRLNVGSGPAIIASDRLELDRWYTVRVRRDRKDGTQPRCLSLGS